MANLTIDALKKMYELSEPKQDKIKYKFKIEEPKKEDAETNLCNSTMWTSCLSLLIEFQKQTKLVNSMKDEYLNTYMEIVNASLKHHTPAVRKEAELLYIELYKSMQSKIETLLVNQKPQVIEKLTKSAKKEIGIEDESDNQIEEEKRITSNIATSKLNNAYIPENITKIFGDETIEMMKSNNPKARLKALFEIKKEISQITVNLSEKRAKEISEPITYLMRLILGDENAEIYLEALKIVKNITSTLAPHLGSLDLHILVGSFIGIIVSNTVNSSLRIQVASDKVIVLFAKHNNIGPFVVAKDIIKNIEKIVTAIKKSGNKKKELYLEKSSFLCRFLSILLLLVNQFSITLCYQADFNDKMVACLSQLVEISDSDQNVKNLITQIFSTLYSIDPQTLENAINKIETKKKGSLLIIKAEVENQLKNGKKVSTDSKSSFDNKDEQPQINRFKMSPSVMKNASRASLFSGGKQTSFKTINTEEKEDQYRNSDGFKSELKGSRRLLQNVGSGMNYNIDSQSNGLLRKGTVDESPSNSDKKFNQPLIRRSQNSGFSKFALSDIAQKSDNVLPPISGTSLGLMGSYEPSLMAPIKPAPRRIGNSHREYPSTDTVNRPPLYRKAGVTVRDGTNFNGQQIGISGRSRITSQTQSDFNDAKREMNSSTGLGSNLNTILTGASLPKATFEISTTNYGVDNKPKKRDMFDGELNKFNLK